MPDHSDLTGAALHAPGTHTHAASTQTATVTTNANTFVASHVFDLGMTVANVLVTYTLLAVTLDGEVFDVTTDSGGLSVSIDELHVSFDGLTDDGFHSGVFERTYPNMATVGQTSYQLLLVPRYITPSVRLQHAVPDMGQQDYAGPNHPTAQVRIDVEYR